MLRKIWKSYYTMRRYGEQQVVRGNVVRSYTESQVFLDIQPVMNEMTVTEGGKRVIKRITAYGNEMMHTEDVKNGIPADRIYFDGAWFECESSMKYEHSIVSHYTTSFVRVSEAVSEEEVSV